MEIPISLDRSPKADENPRHAVWITDAKGLRQIIAANPCQDVINVEGVLYRHTHERWPNGPWVYSLEAA